MEIREMNFDQLDEKLAEVRTALDAPEADLEALNTQIDEIEARKAELKAEAEKAIEERKAIAEDNTLEVVKTFEMEERKMDKKFTRDSAEYREAFFANLVGLANAEQRAITADTNSGYGKGLALPVATEEAIWDQVLTAHPILNDVSIVKSGIVMKVSQMTPSNLGTDNGVKSKKDSAQVVELTFSTNEVVLAGKDYTTYVTLTYAEAKMSQGAMEAFLVNEIANALGELLAKDVFATILSDASANEVTQTSATPESYFELINAALGIATQAQNPVIYAPSALYYGILGEVDSNGQPIVREGVVLGAELKKDNAATKITVVDPVQFVLNVIADTSIVSQEVVTKGGYDIGGYMRAEGCLRKTNAAAFVTLA